MREILFRGKREDNGELVEGYYAWYGRPGAPFIGFRNSIETMMWCEIDPTTIGQYTGLTDKNGNRIFEGDIVRLEYTGKNRGVEGLASVIFENGKFGVRWGWHKDFVCLDGFANSTIEVIGNVFDNPELLGGDNDG